MSEIVQSLIDAMERLPLRTDKPVNLGREAHTLGTMMHFARVNESPMASETTKKDGVRRQLLELIDKLRELNNAIEDLHGDTRNALRQAALSHPESEWKLPEIEAFQIHLSNTFNNTVRALRETPHQEGRGGAPKKVAASMIADFTRLAFQSVTGRAATVITDPVTSEGGGPFVLFLGEVLSIARVAASPEAQARAAIRRADQGIKPGQQGTTATIRRLPKEKIP